jgi:hypothetical protein
VAYDIDNDDSQSLAVTERPIGAGQLRGGAGLDMQVELAHRFPRSIKKFMAEASSLVTLSEDVAESCSYALPRKKKDKETGQWVTANIEGPSARFAEIVLSCWGNARAGIRPAGEDDKTVVSAGYMLDLEKNVGIEVEVPRNITDSAGRRYKQDMVTVTANAAGSIALRNAILKVIPKALWMPLYEKARGTALGDETTLSNKRLAALAWFQKKGASAETIFEHFGVQGIEDITLEHIATLLGYKTALKEGDTTVESLFGKDDPAATGKPAVAMPKAKTPPPAAAAGMPEPAASSAPPAGAPMDPGTGELFHTPVGAQGEQARAPTPTATPKSSTSGNGAIATDGERQLILRKARSAGVEMAQLMETAGIAGLPADLAGLTKDGFIALKDALPQ